MITQDLTTIVSAAFVAHDLPAELGRVTPSDRPDLCDFQCNGAMQAARLAKKNPREIAQAIVQTLKDQGAEKMFEAIDIAGPGFLNFKLNRDFLADYVATQAKNEKLGFTPVKNPEKIVVEFSSPNVAKNMHVGHLRTTIIGDTIARLIEFMGHDTVRITYPGDWGTPMGTVIESMRDEYPDLAFFDETLTDYPDTLPFEFDKLVTLYPKGSTKFKTDVDFKNRVHETTAALQNGHKGYRALWRVFYDLSLNDMKNHTEFLRAHFDVWEGESFSHEVIPAILEDLKDKDLLEESDGAMVVRVARDDDKFDVPPVMMVKSNGAVGYHSTDVATVYRRRDHHAPDRMIYVTDYRQELHFDQVFRAAKLAGYADGIELIHVGYGTLNNTAGKPFKTRDGGVLSLSDFVTMVRDKATERLTDIGLNEKMSDDIFNETVDSIALASIRFGDLSNPPRSDYIFDADKFVSFEGKTGPYIQYTCVRLKRLLDKAHEAGFKPGDIVLDDTQWPLALDITQYAEAVQGAADNYAANILCDYLFKLAQKANTFYQNAPVLTETNAVKRASYLAVLYLSVQVLEQGLSLIGIDIPREM